jgi:hypothetical protein
MKTATKQRQPIIIEKADESVLIQIRSSRRKGSKGKLTFEKSKSLTVQNMAFEEVCARVRAALDPEPK